MTRLVELNELSAEQLVTLRAGESLFWPYYKDEIQGAQAITWVPVSRAAAWALLTDYPHFADWLSGMKEITSVTWLSPDVAEVGYVMPALVRDLHYVLRRVHVPYTSERWTRAYGDMKEIIGGYDFYPDGTTATIIRFHTLVDPGVWVPGFVRDYFSKKGLRTLIFDIREEAIKRYPERGAGLTESMLSAGPVTGPTVSP